MRVLLVEDDALIAQGLQTALRQGGFAVDWMRDGKSAAGALQASVFDLVLLDLGLPQRPGAVLSRAQLEDRLYGWDEQIGSNAIEVYVHGLRRKLGSDAIRTLRGVGYFVPKK